MNGLSPISVDSSDWGTLSANGYATPNSASPYNTKPQLMPPNNPSNLSRLADTPPTSVHSSANSSNPPDGQAPQHRANGNPSPPNSVARSSIGTNATGLMDERKYAQMEAALAEHHRMLVRYLAPALRELRSDPRQNPAARDKLVRLSASQFQELSTDVYDELTRREDERRRGGPNAPGNPVPKYLLPRQNFHPKRNQARQKLSTLQRDRFQQLAMDVFFELERRFPRFGRSASRAEDIPDRNSPSRQGFPLRSVSRTGPDMGPEGFGPRSASRAGLEVGQDFGPRSASRAGPDMGDFGPRSASRAGPDMGGPDGFQRSASRGPDMGPNGFGQPPFNGPSRADTFPGNDAKPLAKMYQSNVMVPNKGTMIEDDSEAENSKPPMNGHGQQFDDLQLKVAELTNKLREKDLELETAQSEPKELNANFEIERSRWNDLRDELERKVQEAQALNDSIEVELAKVRSEHSTLQRDMRGQEGNQRDIERQLRAALEEAQGNHRAEQDNLKLQLEDLQMQARMKEDVLMSQLEDARSTSARGFGDSDEWKKRCNMLEQELSEQRKLTDEVREETAQMLQEMRSLSHRSADAVEKEDALRDQIVQLEKEVRLWKSRYAKTKSQARSLRSSSLGLPVGGAGEFARDTAFVAEDGIVRDVHVMAFQVAMDEMLQRARSADAEALNEGMKHVVMAVRTITTDMEAVAGAGSVAGDAASSVGAPSTVNGGPSANRCAKLRARVSTAANNLITATKAHGAAQGIAPVSLVDAAASHLTAAVVDVVRALKIRRSTAEELARDDDGGVAAKVNLDGASSSLARAAAPLTVAAGRPGPLTSFSESSLAGGSAHGRNASGSSAGYSNYSRYSSRYSANTSPPAQVFSGEIKGFGMGMVRENGIEEFKNFLDDSTALLVRSIQPLVSTIRTPGAAGASSAAAQVAEHVRAIAATVASVVDKTEATLADRGGQMDGEAAAALRRHAPPVLAVLEGAVAEMQAAQQARAGSQLDRIPPLAFRVARATKELVLRVERIEAGEVTAGTELPAEF